MKTRPRDRRVRSAGSALICDELQTRPAHTVLYNSAQTVAYTAPACLPTGLGRLSIKIDHQKATPQDSSRANDGLFVMVRPHVVVYTANGTCSYYHTNTCGFTKLRRHFKYDLYGLLRLPRSERIIITY